MQPIGLVICPTNVFSYIIFTNCYLVEPVTLPPIVSGCLSNNDCPDYTACQSRKCINPCAAPNVCAPNANCRVTRHQAVCTCPDGYIGSPETSCSLRKLKSQNIPNIYQKQLNIDIIKIENLLISKSALLTNYVTYIEP